MSEVSPAPEAGPSYYWSFPEQKVLLLGKASIKGTGHEGYLEWLKSQDRLAVGRLAVASFSSAEEGEAVDLGSLLAANEPLLERVGQRHQFQDWTVDESLAYGRWLYSILPDPAPGSLARLTKDILARANSLALGPGIKNLARNFGNISTFYTQIDAVDTSRRFTKLTVEEAAKYVLSMAETDDQYLYRRIHEQAKQDPTSIPYSALKRLLPKGPATGFLREAGYLKPERGKRIAPLEWGVDFMLANSATPTQRDIKVLSKIGRSLHSSATYRYFGGDSAYQEAVSSSFADALESIKEDFRSGVIPFDLLRSASFVTELIARRVRFGIATELLPELPEEKRVSLSVLEWGEHDFVDHLAGHNPSINWFDVRKASNSYGLFRNAWRTEYVKSLAVDQAVADILDLSRGKLYRRELERFYQGIDAAIDLLDSRNIKALRQVWIDRLQASGKLVSGDEFERLYGSVDNLKTMVYGRRRQRKGTLLNGHRAVLLDTLTA